MAPVADSPLEEAGFESSVPRKTPAFVVISGLVAPPSPLQQGEPTRTPLSKPWSSHAVLTVRSGCGRLLYIKVGRPGSNVFEVACHRLDDHPRAVRL